MEATAFFDVEMEVLKEENLNLEPKLSPERPERPSSPADCAICLEQLKDKSFTDSCLHMFCFHCLKAWSEIKPECPLCKQDFCSIIHNIRSMTDYDEYHVPPVEPPRFTYTPPLLSASEIADSYAAHEFFSNRRRFFSYRTTIMPNTYSIPRVRSSNLVIQPYIDNLQLEANYSHTDPLRSCRRSEVYLRQLETRPPTTGRYRECSPEFYRANETQIHRLARWLHRELLALSQIGIRFNVHDVKQVILDMLVVYNINSSLFHDILSQHLGGHTSRFIQEFYNFATSPYEMDQYDRECVLVRPRNGSHLSFIVTVGRDESEDVQVIPSPPLEEPFRPWMDMNRATPSGMPSSTSSSFRLLSRLVNQSAFRCGHMATTTTSTNPSTSVINLTDSETEDCVILDDAPGPETIVLDDSDNEAENPITSSSSSSSLFYENPHISGHRPLDLTTSRSTSSQTSDSLPIELPPLLHKSSGRSFQERTETSVPVENDVKPENQIYPLKRRRSCSIDSSVLSTCISSDESDRCYRKKRSKRLCRMKSKRGAAVHRRYSSDEFLNESSDEDSVSDSDWEESRRKRKKKSKKSHASKREKKSSSKKRKKPTEHRSKKKKPSSGGASDSERKSKPKKEKTKSKRRARTPIDAVDSPRSTSGSKLCSVVKVVHRDSDSFLLDQPGTSTGYRSCDVRNDFIKMNRRSFFVSDSD